MGAFETLGGSRLAGSISIVYLVLSVWHRNRTPKALSLAALCVVCWQSVSMTRDTSIKTQRNRMHNDALGVLRVIFLWRVHNSKSGATYHPKSPQLYNTKSMFKVNVYLFFLLCNCLFSTCSTLS